MSATRTKSAENVEEYKRHNQIGPILFMRLGVQSQATSEQKLILVDGA